MLHLQPAPAPDHEAKPYDEAVSRLASIRHALRLVDGFGGGPASDPNTGDPGTDERVAAAWDEAGEVRRSLFERRSAASVAAAAAGLDALMGEHRSGRQPNEEASRAMVEEIRRELAELAQIILR